MKKKINECQVQVLDCTIRDGGYINDWDFPFQMVKDIYQRLSRAGIDVVEIGFRDKADNGPLWRECPEPILKQLKATNHNAKLSVMVDFGKADISDFIPASDSAVDIVRVATHKNRIQDALKLINSLKKMGYLTSIQLMGYPQYNIDERKEALLMLADVSMDYVYMADSYGSLFPDQVGDLIEPLVGAVNCKVGFHPHNNLQLAFANTIEAIKHGAQIVDAALYGIGRGAGNLPTEALVAMLQKYNPDKFNLIHVLFCVDMYLLPLQKKFEWGYQLPYMMSGFCECHPYYPREMVEARRYTIDDVWRALNVMKRRQPIGFDPDLLKEILDSGLFEYETSLKPINKNDTHGKSDSKGPSTYIQRYKNRPFLVLANGPGLQNNLKQINQFIEKYDPVILGANYLGNIILPHYHAFVNKKRFAKYAHEVSTTSKLLLSCHFQEDFIQQYTDRTYEKILFHTGERETLFIDNGVISNDCTSVSMLLIAVAATMGNGEIFVAGMDGYVHTDQNGSFYHYTEEDDTVSPTFNLMRQRWGVRTLKLLDDFLRKGGRSGVNIITPTSYDNYYRGIQSLL